jgi:hypothetical protein
MAEKFLPSDALPAGKRNAFIIGNSMGTLQDEFRKAGLVKEKEIEPKQEFIQGEINYTRSNGIHEIRKSLYGRPIKGTTFKPSHGRTRIMHIKEDMDKRKISRDSFQFKVVQFLLDTTITWSSAMMVSAAVKWNRPSTSSLLTNLRKTGFLYFESRQGEKGWVYQLKEQYYKCAAEEICMEYLDKINWLRKDGKKKREKAANELGSEQGGQPHGSDERVKRKKFEHILPKDVLDRLPPTGTAEAVGTTMDMLRNKIQEVLGVKVEVSGNIDITFKLG